MKRIKIIIALVCAGLAFGASSDEKGTEGELAAYYGFGEMELIKLDWDIRCMRVADFNGDGLNDIAIANNRKAKIELLIQKSQIGPGEKEIAVDANDMDINLLTPPTRFDRGSISVSERVTALVCGDLNCDGLVDLAYYGEPKGLYVLIQNKRQEGVAGAEALSWRPKKKVTISDGLSTPDALACADLNNDGMDDLVVASADAVYIVLQKESGTLAEPEKYPTTGRALGMQVGDLNGDKLNDLVLKTTDDEKPVQVRFGLKGGQLGPQEGFEAENPYRGMLADIDAAGGEELLTIDERSRRLLCYQLVSGSETDDDWPILFYPLASGEGQSKRDLVIGDFDGDGLSDVVVSDPQAAELIFYKQGADTGLAEPVRFPGLSDIDGLSAADVDGDGRCEVAALSIKEKVIGLSEFADERLTFPTPVEVEGEPVAMELGDADGDSSIDCVYISRDVNDVRSLRVIYNLGAAQSASDSGETSPQGGAASEINATPQDALRRVGETAKALELKKLASNPDGLKIFDVDQDGLMDVLVFVRYEAPILILQTKKREFEVVDSPQSQASLIKEASLRSIAFADVDGKPGEELLVAQKNFARSLIFAGGRSWTVVDQYNAKTTENTISAVAAFDIEGQGEGDRPSILLLDGQKGQLQLLKAGEDKIYRFDREVSVGRWESVAHLKMEYAALSGGPARSILLFDGNKFALLTPPSESQGRKYLEQRFSYETKIKDASYGNLTCGDINADGRADIIMVDYKRNYIEILGLDADYKPVPAMRFKVFEQKSYEDMRQRGRPDVEPREMTIADVTGDGRSDLITVIHDRIIIYPQD